MRRTLRSALPLTLALTAPFTSACGALASSPGWVGGGLAVEGPAREAEQESREQQERARASSEPARIGAKHILVMHNDSARKPEGVNRTRAQAYGIAYRVLLKIRGGASFDDMVKEYTDEPGGAERLGDLGAFDRGAMVKPFSDTAFALKVGEVSEIVETNFGFHIIKRTQ
jgi:NIMA-interacting peptidyl-prolyl cis-trans isomerase 1